MNEQLRLDAAWQRAFSGGNVSQHYMRPTDSDAIVGTIAYGITHFTRHDKFWNIFLSALKDQHKSEPLSVLITAMSVGCELYDAARIAKGLGLENIHFYGHDISTKFTERAAEGVYPVNKVQIIPEADNWFDMDQPCEGYARIRPECFNNVSILPPSDIRDLHGKFDIVSSTIMNPAPKDIDLLIEARARHLALDSYSVINSSQKFRNLSQFIFDTIGGCNCISLSGDADPLLIPELYTDVKNPAQSTGFDSLDRYSLD